MTVTTVQQLLRHHARKSRARVVARFFKTGKGEYGEGDVFIGVTMPDARKVARECLLLSRTELKHLLHSRIHEERMLALLILINQFEKADEHEQEALYNLYLLNTRYINNWDLVDVSAERIVGQYLLDKPKTLLYKLAKSKNIWERRIAIIASFAFIKQGKSEVTLKIADMLRHDEHDLIQKAVGWMLREVGKRCSIATLERYLKPRYKRMPRTMLRYAIEHLSKKQRTAYLKGSI